MINHTKIRILASKQGVPEEVIEKDYLIDLVLLYISKDKSLREKLVFRGGTALKKIYFRDYRFSEDLDFLVKESEKLKDIEKQFDNILVNISLEYPVQLSKRLEYNKDRLQFFVIFDLVPEVKAVKELKIDICSDMHIPSFQEGKLLSFHPEFNQTDTSIKVYKLEAIASDKIGRILDNNKEPRDIYDLWYALKKMDAGGKIKKEFKNKYGYNVDIPCLLNAVLKEEHKKLWESRLRNQVVNLPEYNVLIKELETLINEKFGN